MSGDRGMRRGDTRQPQKPFHSQGRGSRVGVGGPLPVLGAASGPCVWPGLGLAPAAAAKPRGGPETPAAGAWGHPPHTRRSEGLRVHAGLCAQNASRQTLTLEARLQQTPHPLPVFFPGRGKESRGGCTPILSASGGGAGGVPWAVSHQGATRRGRVPSTAPTVPPRARSPALRPPGPGPPLRTPCLLCRHRPALPLRRP